MKTEFEAKFLNVDPKDVRQRLEKAQARLIRAEYFQKRVNFHLPKEKRSNDAWLRIRDDGQKTTLALKMIKGSSIEDQKEIEFNISSFDDAKELLQLIGCEAKAMQESKRELWKLGDVEMTIDIWPGLNPFIEIEGTSEKEVKDAATLLSFDFTKAIFSSVGRVYKIEYGRSLDEIELEVGSITFDNEKLKILKKS